MINTTLISSMLENRHLKFPLEDDASRRNSIRYDKISTYRKVVNKSTIQIEAGFEIQKINRGTI